MFIALDITKDSLTSLRESVQRSYTTIKLFKKSVFRKKTKSSTYAVFLCFKVHKVHKVHKEEAEEEDIPSSPAKTCSAVQRGKTPTVKKEPVIKKKKKKSVKKEKKRKGKQTKVKEERGTVRKQAIF
jgi:hypothetical protein